MFILEIPDSDSPEYQTARIEFDEATKGLPGHTIYYSIMRDGKMLHMLTAYIPESEKSLDDLIKLTYPIVESEPHDTLGTDPPATQTETVPEQSADESDRSTASDESSE